MVATQRLEPSVVESTADVCKEALSYYSLPPSGTFVGSEIPEPSVQDRPDVCFGPGAGSDTFLDSGASHLAGPAAFAPGLQVGDILSPSWPNPILYPQQQLRLVPMYLVQSLYNGNRSQPGMLSPVFPMGQLHPTQAWLNPAFSQRTNLPLPDVPGISSPLDHEAFTSTSGPALTGTQSLENCTHPTRDSHWQISPSRACGGAASTYHSCRQCSFQQSSNISSESALVQNDVLNQHISLPNAEFSSSFGDNNPWLQAPATTYTSPYSSTYPVSTSA